MLVVSFCVWQNSVSPACSFLPLGSPNVIGEPSVVIVVLWGAHGTVVPPISNVPPPSGLLKRMAVLAGWMLNPSSANSASRCLSSSWRWLRSWLHRVPPSRLAVVVGSRRWRLEGPVL